MSLDTVPWSARLLALCLALLTAMLLFLPATLLHGSLRSGSVSLNGLKDAFLLGALFSILRFGSLFLGAVIFFGPPAVFMNHIALWLRCNFLGFIAAGISAALLGFVIASLYNAGIFTVLREMRSELRYRDDWSLNGTIRAVWFTATICGGGGAAVAWWFMQATRRRIPPPIDMPST